MAHRLNPARTKSFLGREAIGFDSIQQQKVLPTLHGTKPPRALVKGQLHPCHITQATSTLAEWGFCCAIAQMNFTEKWQ